MPIEQLSDIRADSIAEWITDRRAANTIKKEFKEFLLTYTDVEGVSVYGQRVRQLGERESCLSPALPTSLTSSPLPSLTLVPKPTNHSQLRIPRSILHSPNRNKSHHLLLPRQLPYLNPTPLRRNRFRSSRTLLPSLFRHSQRSSRTNHRTSLFLHPT